MKIIAVAGASGSGKSLFSAYLAKRLNNCAIMALDNYYLDKPANILSKNYNFDLPTAFDFKHFAHDLEDIKASKTVLMPQYIYSEGKKSAKSTRIHCPDYLIIEGLYVLMHGSVRADLNYSFFLESPPDCLIARRILRDIKERSTTAEASINQYFKFVRAAYIAHCLPTKKFANMAVTNNYTSRLDQMIDNFLNKYKF